MSIQNREVLFSEIEIASVRLNQQVENLLSMSRLEAGFIQPKSDWCDINEIVFSVIKDHKNDAIHHRILFVPNETLPLCKVDSGLTSQVIYNIIHNAVQHTPAGTHIHIQLSYTDHDLIIVIFDNGTGFPEDEIAEVFHKFYRLQNTATGGTGLGLSIVKGFLEAMNGTITLENRPEGGAKFTINIACEFSSNIYVENE